MVTMTTSFWTITFKNKKYYYAIRVGFAKKQLKFHAIRES